MSIHITHHTYNIVLTKNSLKLFFSYEILQCSPYHCTPELSNKDSKSSASSKSSSESGKCKHENYHVGTGKIPKKKRKVNAAKRSAQHQKEVRKKKPFNPKMLLQGEFEGKDIPMGSKQDPHDVTNPFEFNN
jgi:hypothetical protein